MNTEIKNETESKPISTNKGSFWNVIRNNKIATIFLISLLVILIIWFWKNHQIDNIKESSQKQFAEKQSEALKLFSKPYVWAVRKEMLTKNYQQINLYASDMIHEKGFQSIMVSDAEGIVISSTEKKSEGQQINTIVKPEYLSADSSTINNINDSIMILNSPIMGFNSRLGVLTIYKKIQKINF